MAKEDSKKQQTEETESTLRQIYRGSAAPESVQLDRLEEVGTEAERRLLEERYAAQAEQAGRSVDQRTEQAERELRRAEEEAQPAFQAERDRIAAEEQLALDNQALYAELRGDRGGVGQAQAASIRNTAAVNRAQVEREQRGLAVQTAQKIADLRRQGEYEKADSLLRLTQQHLSELLELERWAKETNLDVAQFNTQLARWEAEYAWQAQRFGVETELSAARLTGAFSDGTPTFEARQAERARLAEAAKQLLAAGLALTPDQVAALGWSEGQYEEYVRLRSLSAGRGGSGKSDDGKNRQKRRRKTFFDQTAGPGLPALADELEKGKGGRGAPFQLVASWVSELEDAQDPSAVYREMEASPYFTEMSDSQRQWVADTLREAAEG